MATGWIRGPLRANQKVSGAAERWAAAPLVQQTCDYAYLHRLHYLDWDHMGGGRIDEDEDRFCSSR